MLLRCFANMVIIKGKNGFYGFITVGDTNYIFEIESVNSSTHEAAFKIDWRLQWQLGSALETFINSHKFQDPLQFYAQLSSFVTENVKTDTKYEEWLLNPLKICTSLKNLKDDVEKVESYIKKLDMENGIIEIETTDSMLRSHQIVLKLGQNYPREYLKIVSHDLPVQSTGYAENDFELSNICYISEFCQKFLALVNNFQEFWNAVSLLDSQCYILDPSKPTFKDVTRRIKLTDTLSVVLTFNPFIPKQIPNIKLLGCQSDVNKYREVLQKNLEGEVWDYDEDVVYNLSNLLEITIPSKMILDENEKLLESTEVGECAICFTWRLNEEIPNEVCEKATCKSVYHSTCLFTYLSAVPRNRDYFGKIQGECPNCDEIILCSVPTFT